MTSKIKCTAKEGTVLTFVYTYSGTLPRDVEFKAEEAELESWFKSVETIQQIMHTPFDTGHGFFDRPVISFALFCLVMQIGGNEELVGAEMNVTANPKVQP